MTQQKMSNKSHWLAKLLYLAGIPYQSSSFEDFVTHGYGKMDSWGFFQYPLYFVGE